MRKTFMFIPAVIAASVLVSCNKAESPSFVTESDEICFKLEGEGFDMSVQTKADAVTSLSSVYWEASDASKVVHAVASYSVTGDKVSTGLFWPKDEVTYSYMASNVSFTSGTGVISANNATDIVVGTASGITKATESPSITLDHIFARTGELELTLEDETYALSNVSWTIQSKGTNSGTAGSYTIGSGWSSATASLAQQALTSASDLYIIPETYTVGVTFTLTKGAYTEEFTKTADLTFVGGKVNNIKAKVGSSVGGAKEIEFNITVTAWGSNDLTPKFE